MDINRVRHSKWLPQIYWWCSTIDGLHKSVIRA